jgi:hypothetical protein
MSKAPYALSNTASQQQCQIAMTSWLTTTLTVTPSSGDLSSGPASNSTTSYASKNTPLPSKRSAKSANSLTSVVAIPTSQISYTTTLNVNSVLSEFVSIYSVLSQYEYDATADSPIATVMNSSNMSALSAPTNPSYNYTSTANATSSPTTCASSCPTCTTIVYISTSTVTISTPPPSPIATLPPIILGNATYTPTGSYYVIGNSTLSPGGSAILVSNSTLLSLGPSGTQLVIAPLSSTAGGPGPSTYDLSPAPASSPPLTTASSTTTTSPSEADKMVVVATATITGPYYLPVVVFPTQPIVIAGTTLTAGASSVTIHETPVSLASNSDFIVVGSSTITLAKTTITAATSSITATATGSATMAVTSTQVNVGSLIWSGLGGTEGASSTTSTTKTTSASASASAASIISNNATSIAQVFTGAGVACRGKVGLTLWSVLGLGCGIIVAGVFP